MQPTSMRSRLSMAYTHARTVTVTRVTPTPSALHRPEVLQYNIPAHCTVGDTHSPIHSPRLCRRRWMDASQSVDKPRRRPQHRSAISAHRRTPSTMAHTPPGPHTFSNQVVHTFSNQVASHLLEDHQVASHLLEDHQVASHLLESSSFTPYRRPSSSSP